MENESFQILSNSELKDIKIINDYIKQEEKKKDTSDDSSVKDHDSNKMDASFVFIRNNSEEEKKNLAELNYADRLNKGFKLIDEIPKRERLFINAPRIRDKQIKKLSFKEILINVNRLNNESRKKLKLKLSKRKIKRDER